MYEIRRVHSNEVEEALALAWEVFLEFKEPDLKPEGAETFKRDVVQNDEFISKYQQGIYPLYAAFDKGKIISIIGMRSDKAHINFVFTKKEYHHKGIATAILQRVLEDLLKNNPNLKEITLNSSPYAKPFYMHIGFETLADEYQEKNGIRFMPMRYRIGERDREKAFRK